MRSGLAAGTRGKWLRAAGPLSAGLFLGLAALAACPAGPQDTSTAGSAQAPGQEGGAEGERPGPAIERVEVDLFAFGPVLGQIAPCGCTSLPLGGLQYAFGYIEANSKAGARLVIEPGSLLYPSADHPEAPVGEAGWAQAEQRASVLHERFAALGDDLISALGPTDFAEHEGGPNGDPLRYALPRVLANTKAPLEGVAKHRVRKLVGDVDAVVTAVADPTVGGEATPKGWPELSDPVAAAKAAIAAAPEAELSVVIAIGPRAFAEDLARQLDVDVVVMGGTERETKLQQEGRPVTEVGGSFVVQPGDRAQTLTHLTLRLDAKDPDKAIEAQWARVASPESIQEQIALIEARIAKFEADPDADPAFIARNKQQVAALKASIGQEPDDPAVATFDQVPVTCMGVADPAAQKAIDRYDAWVAKEIKKRFEGVRTPEPPKGAPTYVGIDTCADCHQEAVDQWKGTVHAGAYETLEKANKQYDLSCVGCHVTGFRQPGGAEVVETRGLVDVQCEQCHGPGSLHAEDPSPENIQAKVPESVCASCHTPEHSDTFDYVPYLRDALGKGHGEAAHKALGAGPKAAELRAAALAKAGGGCKKM